MFNRLRRRVESLESTIGVAYTVGEYPDHVEERWGFKADVEKRLKALEDKAGIKKKSSRSVFDD